MTAEAIDEDLEDTVVEDAKEAELQCPVNARVYHVGEKVPIKGDTFEFPGDFNIIDLHFNTCKMKRKMHGCSAR